MRVKRWARRASWARVSVSVAVIVGLVLGQSKEKLGRRVAPSRAAPRQGAMQAIDLFDFVSDDHLFTFQANW